ncbi:HAD family acid phosphatase [Tunturiibacter gelidoferens]|uniref:Acid phosphatase n=1 Tax=Tunturiibacter gelidiferens TaxID=3069689 RepID=A0ACC5NUD8_9BACT|nr:HAD family acid phosphatase [Edaphobacter lichenicola]MBB5338160.1 acid phosphatase [Edaphobacter lichenicola]
MRMRRLHRRGELDGLGGGVLRVMGVMALAGGVCLAQMGPPVCAVPAGKQVASLRPQVGPRPTVEAAVATGETAAADPTMVVAAEPMENFGVARYRLEDYADCVGTGGCYWADLDAQAKRAEAGLKRLIAAEKVGEKLALVLDIDETSLTNYCEMKREDYGFISVPFNEWAVSPEADMAIPGTLRLFNEARAAGLEVFFITGRPGEQRAATAKNLDAAGYKGWKGLALREGPQKTMATVAYKSEERKKIVDAGYRIVMSVGDQWSDLNGEPRAEISVKLPNPFYYLP